MHVIKSSMKSEEAVNELKIETEITSLNPIKKTDWKKEKRNSFRDMLDY